MSVNVKVDLEPAYVLHQRPYRESSLLLEVFGLHSGRVGLIVKGARRPKSAFRSVLSPFRELLLSWRSRGELGLLVGAEAEGPARIIPPASLVSGLYTNELLVKLLHRHDPHPELFLQYRNTLEALVTPARSLEQILRIFEKRLLESVGYGLILDRAADSGEALRADRNYYYVADVGPVTATETRTGTRVSGATLLALACERLDQGSTRREAKKLMRNVINSHLEGKPVLSRTIFASASQFRKQASSKQAKIPVPAASE